MEMKRQDNTERIHKAIDNFLHGYNCSQAVACAYSDLIGIDEGEMRKLTAGCGRGMGAMEGTCGAVCGALIIANLYDSENPILVGKDLTEYFIEKNGSIICKELKGIGTGKILRSCTGCVEDAAIYLNELLSEKIASKSSGG